MKTIKFRAWEKNLKEMISVDDIQFYNTKIINNGKIKMLPKKNQPIIINTKSAWRTLNDVILMQYTGVKDGTIWSDLTKEEKDEWQKNHGMNSWKGKEIYDGDILKYVEEIEGEYRCGQNIIFYEVVWFKNGWYVKTKNGDDGATFDEFEKCDLKKVGNIYQNPNLLKQ